MVHATAIHALIYTIFFELYHLLLVSNLILLHLPLVSVIYPLKSFQSTHQPPNSIHMNNLLCCTVSHAYRWQCGRASSHGVFEVVSST